MNGKQRLYKDEGLFGYMIFSTIILHNPEVVVVKLTYSCFPS